MPRYIGVNRAGSVWVTERELDNWLVPNGLWYRVDFRQEFPDYLRDRVAAWCRSKDVHFLPILMWERGRPTSPTMWGDWHSYVERMVRRYPWKRYWQVWNEPNRHASAAGGGFGLSDWRWFLEDTAKTIKRVKPDAIVIAGGIAVGGRDSGYPSDYYPEWFRVAPSVDKLAVHTYCRLAHGAVRAIERAQAEAAQPVWCTELGRKSTTDGEDRQAAWFEYIRANTGEVPLFWFDLQDVAGDFDGFGAIRRDGHGKPVWSRLKAAARS